MPPRNPAANGFRGGFFAANLTVLPFFRISILEIQSTATAAHILFDRGLPRSTQGSIGTHSANGLVHSLIVQAGTLSIAAIGHGPILPNAEIPGCFHCIDVCPQEQELPAILALLVFDHLFECWQYGESHRQERLKGPCSLLRCNPAES